MDKEIDFREFNHNARKDTLKWLRARLVDLHHEGQMITNSIRYLEEMIEDEQSQGV